jgi:uncharacterized delta-60 repeat protein
MKRSVVVLAGLLFASMGAHALDGDPDLSFGDGGQVTIARPGSGFVTGTQPTGDLLVLPDGGYLWSSPLEDGSVWVGRALHDGAPDHVFGPTGRVTLPACGDASNVRLVHDGADGLVVWAGSCLVHLRADGSVDDAFGSGAVATGFLAAALARDAAGRYVLAGRAGPTLLVYRFDAAGMADASFGSGGHAVVVVPATNALRELDALAVRSDGRILVGGARGNTHGPNLFVAQLAEGGAPDPSWNGTGLVDLEAPTGYESLWAYTLAVDGDGSVVVGGRGGDGGVSCCLLLARLDAAGALVPGFGLRLFRLSDSPDLYPFFEQRDGLVLLPDGRILMGVIAFPTQDFNHRTEYTLVRAFADGSLDTSFGHDGWLGYTIADPDDVGQTGDYEQMHAIGYDPSDRSVLMLGRTFFEDNSNGVDYVSLVRARFDALLTDGFDG